MPALVNNWKIAKMIHLTFIHLLILCDENNYDFILIIKVVIQNANSGGRKKNDFKAVKI